MGRLDVMQITHGPALLTLLPDKAALWPDQSALILSDVHLGKTAAFRAKGVPLPEGETEEDLRRVSSLAAKYEVSRIIIVGDLFHSDTSLSPPVCEAFAEWLTDAAPQVTLVEGNHDRRIFRFPSEWPLEITPELELAGLHFTHDPADAPVRQPTITGHLHPVVIISSKRRSSLRLPAFLQRKNVLTLPAFGSFTGGHPITLEPTDAIHAIAGRSITTIPHALIRSA